MQQTRLTKQKKHILTILKRSNRPMSINEIYDCCIDEFPKIAKSTIYRNIDALLKQNLIDKYFLSDSELFYKIKADLTEHKHYVICEDCKRIFDLPDCPIHDIESTLQQTGFVIKDHYIQITGQCSDCVNKRIKPD